MTRKIVKKVPARLTSEAIAKRKARYPKRTEVAALRSAMDIEAAEAARVLGKREAGA